MPRQPGVVGGALSTLGILLWTKVFGCAVSSGCWSNGGGTLASPGPQLHTSFWGLQAGPQIRPGAVRTVSPSLVLSFPGLEGEPCPPMVHVLI